MTTTLSQPSTRVRLLSPKDAIVDLTNPPASNVVSLDILRAFAIFLVFCAHFVSDSAAIPKFRTLPPAYLGWSGVDLFFVLSGYLIGAQIWKELKSTDSINIPLFLLRRGMRIWPLYFCVLLWIAFQDLRNNSTGAPLCADATFLSNYFHHQVGGGWSLSTEEQFYIIFPLVILLFGRFLKPISLLFLPILALVALPVIRYQVLSQMHNVLSEADRQRMYMNIHTHADGLAFGVLIAWFVVFRPAAFGTQTRRILVALASISAGGFFYLASKEVFNYTALAFTFGGLTIFAIGFTPSWPKSWSTFFFVLSRLSYGVYLIHFGLLPLMLRAFPFVRGTSNFLVFSSVFVVCFALCLGFAALTFTFIERPGLELRQRLLRRPVSLMNPPPIPSLRYPFKS